MKELLLTESAYMAKVGLSSKKAFKGEIDALENLKEDKEFLTEASVYNPVMKRVVKSIDNDIKNLEIIKRSRQSQKLSVTDIDSRIEALKKVKSKLVVDGAKLGATGFLMTLVSYTKTLITTAAVVLTVLGFVAAAAYLRENGIESLVANVKANMDKYRLSDISQSITDTKTARDKLETAQKNLHVSNVTVAQKAQQLKAAQQDAAERSARLAANKGTSLKDYEWKGSEDPVVNTRQNIAHYVKSNVKSSLAKRGEQSDNFVKRDLEGKGLTLDAAVEKGEIAKKKADEAAKNVKEQINHNIILAMRIIAIALVLSIFLALIAKLAIRLYAGKIKREQMEKVLDNAAKQVANKTRQNVAKVK